MDTNTTANPSDGEDPTLETLLVLTEKMDRVEELLEEVVEKLNNLSGDYNDGFAELEPRN